MNRTWTSFLLLTACTSQCRVHPGDSTDTVAPTETAEAAETAETGETGIPVIQAPTPMALAVRRRARRLTTSEDGGGFGDGRGPALMKLSATWSLLSQARPTEDFWPAIRAGLLPQGTLVLPGLATGVTITAEGHAALLTGSRVAQAISPVTMALACIVQSCPHSLNGYGSISICRQSPLRWSATPFTWVATDGAYTRVTGSRGALLSYDVFTQENGQPVGSDTEVISGVQNQMEQHDTRIVVANLHQMDRAGHYNASPTAYAEGVKNVDQAIVDFWDWIQQSEDYANQTALVVVADHGRHRWDESEDYRHHGDQCTGCRQIPMFIAGPGIRRGHEVSATYTIEDVGQTIAWLMDIDLPHAEGQILCEAMTDIPATNGREGISDLAITDTIRAEMIFGDNPETKSHIYADGTLLSDGDAIHAEAPRDMDHGNRRLRLLERTGNRAFIVGLHTDVAMASSMCPKALGEDEFSEITTPLEQISPYWAPALHSDRDGNLLMAYADNVSGNWEAPIRLSVY